MGKTRLALAVAWQLVDGTGSSGRWASSRQRVRFPDGISFVALAPLRARPSWRRQLPRASNFHPEPAIAGLSGPDEQLADLPGRQASAAGAGQFRAVDCRGAAGNGAAWPAELLAAAARGSRRWSLRASRWICRRNSASRSGDWLVPDPQFTVAEHAKEERKRCHPVRGRWRGESNTAFD